MQTHFPRYSALLAALFALLLVPPFLPAGLNGQRVIGAVTSLVLIVGVLSVHRRRLTIYATLLVVPALVSSWAAYALATPTIYLIGTIFRCSFFALLVITISMAVLRQNTVTGDTIAGAAAGYILLALFWASLYGILEQLKPGSFVLPIGPSWAGNWGTDVGNASSVSFTYFSFVTITTLGYGDMAPITAEAGMLAAAEATAGQLYIAVLLARLVALHVASKN